jgi:transposase
MEKENPPVFGMLERGGQGVIHLRAHVQQKTSEPLMKDTMESGTLVYTDEYRMYARLERGGYAHQSVNYGRGE